MAKSKAKSKDNELIPKIILFFIISAILLSVSFNDNSNTNYNSNTRTHTPLVTLSSEDYDIFTDPTCYGSEYFDKGGWSVNYNAHIYNKENFDIKIRNIEFSFYNEKGKLVGKDNATIHSFQDELKAFGETFVSSKAYNLDDEVATDKFFSSTDYDCKAIVYFYKN